MNKIKVVLSLSIHISSSLSLSCSTPLSPASYSLSRTGKTCTFSLSLLLSFSPSRLAVYSSWGLRFYGERARRSWQGLGVSGKVEEENDLSIPESFGFHDHDTEAILSTSLDASARTRLAAAWCDGKLTSISNSGNKILLFTRRPFARYLQTQFKNAPAEWWLRLVNRLPSSFSQEQWTALLLDFFVSLHLSKWNLVPFNIILNDYV